MQEIMSDEEYKKLPSLKGADPLALAEAIHDILYDKRGRNIKILKVESQTVITDYLVLCTGTSGTQVRGLADEVEYKTSLRHLHPTGVEGRGNSSWIALDYGTVMVHIFNRDARDFYNLDKLYGATTEVSSDEGVEANENTQETQETDS